MINYSLISVIVYAVIIIGLAVWGRRGNQSIESFAIGAKTSGPIFIGLSLAANMTSAATFVINPGLVYLYGFSGFIGYGTAAPLGIFMALIIMSKKFREIGEKSKILTVPQWIGEKYKDKRLTFFFAVLSLLQITFIVLIAVGLTIVLGKTLNLPLYLVLLILLLFTFGYIMLGGASIHILTNSFQSIIMISVAILLLLSGILFSDISFSDLFNKLNEIDTNLVSITNPDSLLFRDIFEVFIANFLVGIAIICQPHIISKSLYLRSDSDLNKYLITTISVATLFFFVLFTGLFARVILPGELVKPDQAIAAYINYVYPPEILALVTLGILAAGFSTLEGLFIALSSIFSNDVFKNILIKKKQEYSQEKINRLTLISAKVFLFIIAIFVYIFSIDQINNPSLSVAIFAQNGVYGLFVATFWPIFLGIFKDNINKIIPVTASIIALITHFGIYYFEITIYHNNPGVAAAFAIILSGVFIVLSLIFNKYRGIND